MINEKELTLYGSDSSARVREVSWTRVESEGRRILVSDTLLPWDAITTSDIGWARELRQNGDLNIPYVNNISWRKAHALCLAHGGRMLTMREFSDYIGQRQERVAEISCGEWIDSRFFGGKNPYTMARQHRVLGYTLVFKSTVIVNDVTGDDCNFDFDYWSTNADPHGFPTTGKGSLSMTRIKNLAVLMYRTHTDDRGHPQQTIHRDHSGEGETSIGVRLVKDD